MASQVQNGKAFEWAVATSISKITGCPVTIDVHARKAEACFGLITAKLRGRFLAAAGKAVQHVLEKEGVSTTSTGQVISIRILGDSAGKSGDVRDVVFDTGEKQVGISCKTNHEAFKHPRLSKRIDWVSKWGLDSSGCSASYKKVIAAIFDELSAIKHHSKGTALFADLENLQSEFYNPILAAFEQELLRLSKNDEAGATLGQKLTRYVVGTKDFYKVIARPDSVHILAFNFNGTLNVPKSKSPARLQGIDRFDGSANSINVRLDRGYGINFRIHSAKSTVEPSLKFDITAISLPPSEIYQNHISL